MLKHLIESFQNWWGKNYSYGNQLSDEYLDDEMYGWQSLQRDARSFSHDLIDFKLEDLRRCSQFLYLTNCHYRGLIRTYLKYVFGKPIELTSEDETENAVWQAWKKKFYLRSFCFELGKRFFRDGEVFLYVPEWKFINPGLVQTPTVSENVLHGIELEDGDPCRPIAYHVRQGTSYERLDASQILHICEKDSDEVRGLPYFLPTMTKTREFEKWLGDRLMLNRIRSSIALVRKHKNASPSQVKSFADSAKTSSVADRTTSYGATIRQKIFEPGTIIDTNDNTAYEFLSPNTGAQEVQPDGRAILLSIAAATGLPEFMVSGDSSNANYASHLVSESTGIKEFEYWQQYFGDILSEIWWREMERNGMDPAEDPQVSLPPLASRNALEATTRDQILYQNGAISLAEWRRREGVDDEQIDSEIGRESDGIGLEENPFVNV